MWSPDLVQRALRFATEAHQRERQTVPGTDLPYLLHLAQVTAEVMAVAGQSADDTTLAVLCAILHDTLEDTPTAPETIEALFGAEVRAGVQALTKDTTLPKDQRMSDSLRRIQAQPTQVAWVKLADRITNLQTPPAHWSAVKIAAYKVEAALILEHLGAAHPKLAARLREKLAAYPPAESTHAG